MAEKIADKIKGYKGYIWIIKILLSISILAIIMQSLFIDGIKPYYSYKDYEYRNYFEEEQAGILTDHTIVSQEFTAKGNILDNVSLFIGETKGEILKVSICSGGGTVIAESEMDLNQFSPHSWNKIGLSTAKLNRGEAYKIIVSSELGLNAVYYDTGDAPEIWGRTSIDDGDADVTLVAGLQFTYTYLTLASIFELLLKCILSLLLGLSLCFCILRIEELYDVFKNSETKKGFSYALYFSVSLVLIYNPLEEIRNEMTEFGRVIGAGVAANVDVSKRISNFSRWFILFAVSYVLFYLLSNYFLQKKKSKESEKAEKFLDHFMVLANCSLILRCITYFNDESSLETVFYFSSYAVILVVIAAISYILLKLDRNIKAADYMKLHLTGVSLSIPLTIFVALELGAGRVLLGICSIVTALILLFCKYGGKLISGKYFGRVSTAGVLWLPLIPLITSVFIESIHILNQYKIFVAHPARLYKVVMAFAAASLCIITLLLAWKKAVIKDWKSWSYPLFILGVSFLSIQIPISSTYKPNLVEGANYSVLISDFLNHGTIPIVQHYGGHMMTSVWEGLIYGLVNHDYTGAIVSPYSSLTLPVCVLLFYYLVKRIWDEDAALFTVLLFPFYSFWSYFGLGMLICLAAMAYVRKRSYDRAAALWAAVIWCAIYRLDLGFSFGIAVIISLALYVGITKNLKAIKELGITLIGWGIAGCAVWFMICFAKGIQPVNRLIEFLEISLSNQNWAFTGIGNTGNTVFGWSYIIIPFLMVICLIYTVFSKSMRVRIGNEKWLLLLIFGCSYFGNFSRGLVRHSLVENRTYILIWCGYLFLAMFLVCIRDNRKLFLPALMALVLCDTLFIRDSNFSETSLADGAVSKPEAIIESWKPARFSEEEYSERHMTYWERLKYDKEVVGRVQINKELDSYVNKYDLVFNALLDGGDTFVDFINKTLIYSLVGKENPAYVSQSPLQLSGEFAQKEFIKQIEGVPLVLMPIDADQNWAEDSLDGITNAYRNYKASEYIYQNYRPLCRYDSDFAIWCLKDDYKKYAWRLAGLSKGTEYLPGLVGNGNVGKSSVKLLLRADGSVKLSFDGVDPRITGLQNLIDTSSYVGSEMLISIEYETDIPGEMQIFYTTEDGESYVTEKVASADIDEEGTANFKIPVTEHSKLRLDIPEGGTVILKSIVAKSLAELVDYGYDGPIESDDGNGNPTYNYISALHNHSIGQLPRIWAEGDKKNSIANKIVAELDCNSHVMVFDTNMVNQNTKGNYLRITAQYDGTDVDGFYEDDDEQLEGTVILGTYKEGEFTEKCRFAMSFKEDIHDYLIRCSTDYYWYTGDINAVQVQSDETLHIRKAQILEGD